MAYWQGDAAAAHDYRGRSDTTFTTVALAQRLLLILSCFAVLHAFNCILLSPLRRTPGPLIARFSRLWLAYHGYKGDLHSTLLALHQKHGDIVRIGPKELSVVEPEAVKTVYGKPTPSVLDSVSMSTLPCHVYAMGSLT